MSSSICTHFSQNAWKKDLCSNCFKSKDEHKQAAALAASSKYKSLSTSLATATTTSLSTKTGSISSSSSSDSHNKTDYPNKNKRPVKSIIKRSTQTSTTSSSSSGKSKHKTKVSFPKNLSEVIGYGGEWSDDSDDDDHDFMNLANDRDDDKALGTDDEESLELKRITRANTDFNMNNGNLLGDAQENIKKSFAALKLGAPQVDKEGKKQTLQINVIPFGCTEEMKEIKKPSVSGQMSCSTSTVKAKFETKTTEVKYEKSSLTGAIKKTTSSSTTSTSSSSTTSSIHKPSPESLPSLESDGKNSPPLERAMEKSLLDEISETLEKNQNEKLAGENKNSSSLSASTPATNSKIKFEIGTLTESLDSKPFLDLKKPIVRHSPITKDQVKPKVNVFHKYSDSDSNCSDSENGVSAYYDVVETSQTYENLPDGKYEMKEVSKNKKEEKEESSIFSSSQYITDMLLSSKTRAASYNLHEGNFMTSKITSDGLIVTKCSSDDALDSTASSFDGSSDEETSYNMIRSESDSGIGISIGHDYKNINLKENERDRLRVEKKLSASTNNSDYEDIQVTDQKPILPIKDLKSSMTDKSNFSMEKSRELHGEPDGSADPDGSLENQDCQQLPELPKSPPPSTKMIDARPSFLHGLQKQHPPILLKKPDLPAKPLVSPLQTPMKTFMSKRPTATNSSLTTNNNNAAANTEQQQQQQQQVISQLQMVMSKSSESSDNDSLKDDAKLKKGKAPNPPMETKTSAPPTPERDYNMEVEFQEQSKKDTKQQQQQTQNQEQSSQSNAQTNHLENKEVELKYKTETDNNTSANLTALTAAAAIDPNSASNIYTRKIVSNSGTVGKNSAAALIKEKDKRERATINPKFRSLNTFVTQRSNAIKNLQLQNATPALNFKQSMTPEPIPRNPKNLSLSEENLSEVSCSKSVTTSMSITNLNAASQHDKKSSANSKTKTKFSIKKFLRMGTTKTTENLTKQKESIYSEICTGDDVGVAGKPRLVIIHPLDINTTAVEVVKDITKTNETVNAQTVAVVTAKPPAPPLRSLDSQRTHEVNKPARPPPPKSAELRRKQQISVSASNTISSSNNSKNSNSSSASGYGSNNSHNTIANSTSSSTNGAAATTGSANNLKMFTSSPKPTSANNNIRIMGEQSGSIKSKSDNVYANLGEIRSSIAPRKPERTASMREREAQLELARKRHLGGTHQQQQQQTQQQHQSSNQQQQQQINKENADTISICSSNGENVSTEQQHSTSSSTTNSITTNRNVTHLKTTLSPQLSNNSNRLEGKPPTGSRTSTFERKKNEAKPTLSNKLEIFENTPTPTTTTSANSETRPSSLKDSVRKINSTIDSYLKDKREYENMYEFVKSPQSPPPPPARSADVQAGQQRLMQTRRNNLQLDNISVASYTRSEYGPSRYLNSSLANIPRMISASYCGSEMGDLDIYLPYSYYGSENGGDITGDINDSVWGIPSAVKNRAKTTNRLRMRKGRSVVHKTIEDNYSAVVGANHEALAQVLEQLQQTPIIPPALRPLANAINLRFEDFNILEGAQAFVVGKKAFHAALWTTAPVTLALSADCNQLAGVGGELNQLSGGVSGALNPITEFCDVVPSYHLPLMPTTEVTLLQATISVLPRLQLDTLQSIGAILKGKSQVLDKSNFNFRGSIPNLNVIKDSNGASNMRNGVSVQNLSTLNEESADKSFTAEGESAVAASNGIPAFDDVMSREVSFIMLQLINGMKNLQVKAVEEMPLSLSNVVLSKEYDNKDAQARLCVLQGNNSYEDEPMGTLCKCAHIALTEMLPTTKMTPILADILLQERSESLSKSKSVLEFILWGPSDVALTGSAKERETALQRWLDLERATVLHGLVRTRVELTVYDECHLMFLVRSTAKIMNDAAKIINQYQEQHTNNHQD